MLLWFFITYIFTGIVIAIILRYKEGIKADYMEWSGFVALWLPLLIHNWWEEWK
jgi:hypothetical protein